MLAFDKLRHVPGKGRGKTMKSIGKSAVLGSGLLVIAGLACIGLAFLPLAGVVQAATEEKTFTLDVAIDCRTWRFNQGIADSDVGRGDSFIANGKIFPAGTLGTGATGDPNAPGSIGTFIETGTMAATLAEIDAGKRPAFVGTWLHLLDDGRGIVAIGPHPDSGPMAVIGGMGGLSGANGQISVDIIGTNSTGCPNIRSTFVLHKQRPSRPEF
jgi:hypothetical protein